MNLIKAYSKIIEISFYLLFFLVPLIWLPVNSELFEFNKMILVYLLTVVVTGSWLLKSLAEQKFQIRRTALDIPIALFLFTNICSTIFSLDPHTSLFGYYGRWHGGLLSTLSYIILYYALVTHFEKKQIYYFLASLITSGLLISVYAVLQHPNPLFKEVVAGKTIFHGIDYDYWAVDVENRVFGTLGQPNWLAAFLSMLIFPTISLLFIFKKVWQQILVFAATTVYYLAFTFTYSRGGLVGLLFGALTFVALFPIYKPSVIETIRSKLPLVDISQTLSKLKSFLIPILALIILIFITNHYFGNALAARGGLQTTTSVEEKQQQPTRPPTQLELSGNQTAKIRTIVWTGAVDIFKHYPLFGSGVETFGYSYYLFRPVDHNQTSEWDYLYNKAHNEYLNFLSTTGAFGFLSYIILITVFELIATKTIISSNFDPKRLLSLGLLAGFNANLAQNFFGFSVVPTALLFFLIPAIFFFLNDSFGTSYEVIFKRIALLHRSLYNNLVRAILIVLILFGIYFTISMWVADYFYNRSLSSETYQRSIADLRTAIILNKAEPLYQAELAKNLSALAETTFSEVNKSKIKEYSSEARKIINQTIESHPNNTSLWIDKRTIDYNLSKIDPAENLELLKTAEKLKELAPTDASIQYDVALVYLYLEKERDAVNQLEKIVALKKDYREPVLMLVRTYVNVNETGKALKLLEDWLKTNPSDTEAEDLLKTLLTS